MADPTNFNFMKSLMGESVSDSDGEENLSFDEVENIHFLEHDGKSAFPISPVDANSASDVDDCDW